jgi:hypothetical protein
MTNEMLMLLVLLIKEQMTKISRFVSFPVRSMTCKRKVEEICSHKRVVKAIPGHG